MKSKNRLKKSIASKGDRLKWASLREVKSVKLTPELTKGRHLTVLDLSKSEIDNLDSLSIIVP